MRREDQERSASGSGATIGWNCMDAPWSDLASTRWGGVVGSHFVPTTKPSLQSRTVTPRADG